MAAESKGDETPLPVDAAVKGATLFEDDALRYAVAVDGSEMAHKAFLETVKLMNEDDYIQVIHVADNSKAYLPYDLRPSSIQEAYETNCLTRFAPERYAVVKIRKEEGKTAREAICTYVNKVGFDYLVVGMVGRKGPKLDPTILGSTADYSLRAAHCSSIIVKKPTRGANKFVVGVDGSDRAHKSVAEIISMANDDDEIVILNVTDADGEAGLKREYTGPVLREKYSKLAASAGARCPVSFVQVEQPRGQGVAAVLTEYAFDNDATYLVVGADGVGAYLAGRHVFGSNSDRVVRLSRPSVIVTQDRSEKIDPKRE
eukprot:CAMPEP_0203829328 /NCGR_PEP_ID=MMETSP0115-20131106/63327_1 /ASSEMBLY_ACC=CAM_ASM_000227 /TAXON_ID=33651 /ORGANISM="Bicosoecid sp, Strain ms1" /LENGTH=314 /DNA_ID=CAMNT_0050738393 /DNA_START=1 /DNA_END=945 /DNA_ORIENTATION=+